MSSVVVYGVPLPHFYKRRPMMDMSLQLAVVAFFVVMFRKTIEVMFHQD